ncbi:GtrA family protein [Demequina sp.]|uniref:GtrA family protein n=1 Tax=Demequina sp. TaxID=2050685 RepID=UPI0025BC6DF3|nr:GtrA family protein [Demequina sp.]
MSVSIRAIVAWLRQRAGTLARFGAVGVAGIVVNLGVFNALRLGPLGPDVTVAGNEDRVVTAKVIATIASIVFAWIAHRGWTFKGQRRHRAAKELMLFGAVNAVAIAVEASLVALTHHGFGWTSLLADNASSLVGIGLGTVIRYFGFTMLVFAGGATDDAGSTDDADD